MPIDQDFFDLNKRYASYLKAVELSEDKMHPVQRTETKRAFFAGCASMIGILTDPQQYSDEETAEIIALIYQQLTAFAKT